MTLIDKYAGLPVCEFRDLMSSLPPELQEQFVIVIPEREYGACYSNEYVLYKRPVTLEVELRDDNREAVRIPVQYRSTIKKMEAILRNEWRALHDKRDKVDDSIRESRSSAAA